MRRGKNKFAEWGHNPSFKIGLYLSSGDPDMDDSGCQLALYFLGWFLYLSLPPILRPYREKVFPRSWSAEDIARLGRNWYWSHDERRYGFQLFEDHFSIFYGRQSDDSRHDHREGWLLPWLQWTFVRHSIYDLQGRLFWSGKSMGSRRDDARGRVPKAVFEFADFDGEVITAATFIEEREWHRGTGWFKWLRHFCKPLVRRSLDIEFSKETGPRKGSWKGGTIGHGIDILPGELHMQAFYRYCDKHKMRPLRQVVASDSDPKQKQPANFYPWRCAQVTGENPS